MVNERLNANGRSLMDLEFFADGSWDGGLLVLIWGGGRAEVTQLRTALRALAGKPGLRVALHELPFMKPIQGCDVLAISSHDEIGVVQKGTAPTFEWIMKPGGWDNAEGLLQPFTEPGGRGGFQFLNRGAGPEVIYSTGRSW
jgi:hypothetical protein